MKLAHYYLIAYNAIQFLGWGAILVKTIVGLINGYSNRHLYASVKFELEIFQTAALLEILHSIVGLVRSPVGTTVIQVYSRISIVWSVLYFVESSRVSVGVPMLLLAWSITEVIRYSFYALGMLLDKTPHFVIWMRYTFFVVLYPLGASGEVLTLLAALPEVYSKKHLTLEMPNPANISFPYYYYLIFLCFFYLPGFPQMYFYMFGQRKKVLGSVKND